MKPRDRHRGRAPSADPGPRSTPGPRPAPAPGGSSPGRRGGRTKLAELRASIAQPGRYSTAFISISIFLFIALIRWRPFVYSHEAMYFLGPHKLVAPWLLAKDLTWSTLPPTSFLYDHLLALFWNSLGDLGIATVGRIIYWALTAWSLALLARLMRLPPWSVVVGFALWLLSGQTLVSCGRPIEGFQPKALSYPLFYFALVFAMQGRAVQAGMAAGLSTAFHIIVGGWGCFAVFASMVLNRYSPRKLLGFLLGAAPFIVPLVIAVASFNVGDATERERFLMDKIYVAFAAPHCCDLTFLMNPLRWINSIAVFAITPVLFYLRPRDRGGRMPAYFNLSLIGLFAAGVVAQKLEAYWFLKLFPFQLANSLPLLFLFILTLAAFGGEMPKPKWGKLAVALGALVCAWMMFLEGGHITLIEAVERLQIRPRDPNRAVSYGNHRVPMDLYNWIRNETPRDSIFITPHIGEFWVLSERAQVASMRHPPFDKRLIEWRRRLIELNGDQRFNHVGFDIEEELDEHEAHLTVEQIARLRDLYGATHYLTDQYREDLAQYQLFESKTDDYYVYDVAKLPKSAEPGK